MKNINPFNLGLFMVWLPSPWAPEHFLIMIIKKIDLLFYINILY